MIDFTLLCIMLKIDRTCLSFLFFSIRVFFTDTDNSQDSRERDEPSFVPLYHFHPLKNIETFICNFACEMTITYFCLPNRNACVCQAATLWDLPPYRIIIWVIDWWCNVCLFTLYIDTRFLLQRFNIGNWWIWTQIYLSRLYYKRTD